VRTSKLTKLLNRQLFEYKKMKNKELAQIFEKMADILEFKGDNVFKINAYRKASRTLKDLTVDVEQLREAGKLMEIPGVGSGIAKKIEEYLKTGKITKYEEAKEGISDEFLNMLNIPGMGPKTLSLIHKELKISSLSELEKALHEGKLRDLPGMGAKKEENILRGIKMLQRSQQRMTLGEVLPLVDEIIHALKQKGSISKIQTAGSLRRMRETIGDIDLLAMGKDNKKIVDDFTRLSLVTDVLAAGETKASVIVQGGTQVDLRVVPEESYGAALQYFTGSKAHNIHLREIARSKGLKVNEYGIFKGDKKIGGAKEEDIYDALNVPIMPPEMREDRGEIEAAIKGKLPHLIELSDIKGDFHVHSKWSDGSATIEELAQKAKELGYEYIVIADHSQSLKIGGGLTEDELAEKIEEIKEVNKKLSGITVLSAAEVDIKADGLLDYSDEQLKALDVVIAAVHSGFKQTEGAMTQRILKALDNPYVHILAHPTGGLIGAREPYSVDLEKVMKKAADKKVALEINAYYERLDLNDTACRRAKELGAKLAIGTDSHHLDQLWMMKLGVAVARRGWLEPDDVLNTYDLKKLKHWLRK
jgi:DNA polymerase (family 10)